jgi:hypothetical protein
MRLIVCWLRKKPASQAGERGFVKGGRYFSGRKGGLEVPAFLQAEPSEGISEQGPEGVGEEGEESWAGLVEEIAGIEIAIGVEVSIGLVVIAEDLAAEGFLPEETGIDDGLGAEGGGEVADGEDGGAHFCGGDSATGEENLGDEDDGDEDDGLHGGAGEGGDDQTDADSGEGSAEEGDDLEGDRAVAATASEEDHEVKEEGLEGGDGGEKEVFAGEISEGGDTDETFSAIDGQFFHDLLSGVTATEPEGGEVGEEEG